MINKLREKLNKNDNHGSSFVLVIVATTFMCILVSALLMGALMTYKLKFYKLNSLNNFYEVETALDEIYAGVGASTNEHLYSAYSTTAELVVVYDTNTQSYVSLTEDEANKLFKRFFMSGFIADNNYKGIESVKKTLESFISNQKSVDNANGVYLDTSNMQLVFTDSNGKTRAESFDGTLAKSKTQSTFNKDNVVSIAFRNICVKRNVEIKGTSAGNYEQSITTDIVLTQPQYKVSFNMDSSIGSSLFDYAMLADMGLEVDLGDDATNSKNDSTNSNVKITGNIYAASDYYNKDYNADAATKVTSWYEDQANENDLKWGNTDRSINSGIYVNGNRTNLNIESGVIVCPGTLGVHNGAKLLIKGKGTGRAEVWTDNIVLGGSKGGSMTLAADTFVYDDTELNADDSKLSFNQGTYYGYSYNAADSRSVDYLRGVTSGLGVNRLASNFKLRSHFSDSAIIVNGKNSELDLSKLDSLYIAGKSYIEFSKIAASDATTWNNRVDSEEKDDSEKISVDDGSEYAYTNLTDYSTGQSLDVKTNQLIFLTQWAVADTGKDDGSVYLRVPDSYTNSAPLAELKKLYDDYATHPTKDGAPVLDFVKVIPQVVSGNTYYYLYIDESGNQSSESKAEQFAEKYYDILQNSVAKEVTENTYNVVNYVNFKVKLLLPDSSLVKSGAAVTDQREADENGNKKLFLRKSVDAKLDVENALRNTAYSKSFLTLYKDGNGGLYNKSFQDVKNSSETLLGSGSASKAEKTSNFLSYMYINMKDHLKVTDRKDEKNQNINAWNLVKYTKSGDYYTYSYDSDADKYSYNYSVTPINQYIDMSKIASKSINIRYNDGEYAKGDKAADEIVPEVIIIGSGADGGKSGTITLGTTNKNGELKGIVVTTGNVEFDTTVKSFTGMIIAGGKVKINHGMTINASATYVSGLLKACSEVKGEDEREKSLRSVATDIFKTYASTKDETKPEDDSSISISDISYEDILTFQNWKRNVE